MDVGLVVCAAKSVSKADHPVQTANLEASFAMVMVPNPTGKIEETGKGKRRTGFNSKHEDVEDQGRPKAMPVTDPYPNRGDVAGAIS
ncbi:hypothetical protein OFB99_24130, partial [Escherichia coli]|nr:hypothetical protein [Escherichia coli]